MMEEKQRARSDCFAVGVAKNRMKGIKKNGRRRDEREREREQGETAQTVGCGA